MAKSPDVLQPVEAYALVFEKALGLPHSDTASKLLRRARYRESTYTRSDLPLPIQPLVPDPSRAANLVSTWDQGLSEASGITNEGLRAISQSFGIEDGIIRPELEVASGLNLTRPQLRDTISQALNGVEQYLIHGFLRQPELEGNLPGIEGRLRGEIMLAALSGTK